MDRYSNCENNGSCSESECNECSWCGMYYPALNSHKLERKVVIVGGPNIGQTAFINNMSERFEAIRLIAVEPEEERKSVEEDFTLKSIEQSLILKGYSAEEVDGLFNMVHSLSNVITATMEQIGESLILLSNAISNTFDGLKDAIKNINELEEALVIDEPKVKYDKTIQISNENYLKTNFKLQKDM